MTAKFIKIHIPLGEVSAIGPGKADLLEAIIQTGSISAAGRQMGMSYRRSWDLVDTMNHSFIEPLVVTVTGGSGGGGAQVTEFGREVLHRYREIEAKADAMLETELAGLSRLLKQT